VTTPKDFVDQLRTAVVDENIDIYRDLFANTSVEKTTDPYWKRALTLFRELSSEKQEVFFEIVRQVAVDTTSNVLGVIDGVNSLKDMDTDLSLVFGDDRLTLSGDLQSLFLAEEEKLAMSCPMSMSLSCPASK
jgi:hypothetical protein